jgi:hypothetical protein
MNIKTKLVLFIILLFTVTVIYIRNHRYSSVSRDIKWNDLPKSWDSDSLVKMKHLFRRILIDETGITNSLATILSECVIDKFSMKFHKELVNEVLNNLHDRGFGVNMHSIYTDCLLEIKSDTPTFDEQIMNTLTDQFIGK